MAGVLRVGEATLGDILTYSVSSAGQNVKALPWSGKWFSLSQRRPSGRSACEIYRMRFVYMPVLNAVMPAQAGMTYTILTTRRFGPLSEIDSSRD